MHLTIAVCDDSKIDCDYVCSLLEKYSSQREHGLTVKVFSSAESFLFEYEENNDFDLLLLDVEMPGIDGVSLAKTIRRRNFSVPIVFITGFTDYIADGYDVDALHYLLKPLNTEKFFEILDKAVKKIETDDRYILLDMPGETVKICINEISFIDVSGNYITVHTGNKDYVLKKSLNEFTKSLDKRFYRLGRSTVINLHTVRRITRKSVTLSSGVQIDLPRGHYDSLNRAFIDEL